MALIKVELQGFRCFSTHAITFDEHVTVISGKNGIGKTSIIEALYYLCFLKSFRSRLPQELIRFDEKSFFIKATVMGSDNALHTIQVGYQAGKKLAKLDGKAITSYKELFEYFRVVVMSCEDIMLITGNPDERRSFLDHFILLYNHDYMALLKDFKHILAQKNALLEQAFEPELYDFWTKRLFDITVKIQACRLEALETLQTAVLQQIQSFFGQAFGVRLVYKAKRTVPGQNYTDFIGCHKDLQKTEVWNKKAAFGAHLDDFSVTFDDASAKKFSSRGQQKLIAFLMKIAQIMILKRQGLDPVLLLDDFMADFDDARTRQIMALVLSLNCQVVITSPVENSPFLKEISPKSMNWLSL